MKQYSRSYILFLALLLVSSYAVRAQEVLYSKYDDFEFRSGEFSVVGKAGDRLYVYRGSAEGYYLDAYDDDMHRLATVILDFLPRRCYGTKFITYEDRMILLYQSSEGGNVVLYGALLGIDGRLMKKPQVIDEVKSGFLGGRSGIYGYAVSPDKQEIVAYGVNTDKEELHTRVVWLDTAINKQTLSTPDFAADNNLNFGEGIVDNSGKFFLPAYTPYGSKEYADRVWLLSTEKGGQIYATAEMPLNGLFASGTYMEPSRNGDKIYVGGFYSDRKNGHYEGIIYTHYSVSANSFNDFKKIAFSEKLRHATGERNKKRAFNDFRVKQLIVRNDGGFVMIAESFYVAIQNNYNSGFGYYSWYYPTMSASVREYYYGDIIAISCNGEGKPEWTKFIRKDQFSRDDNGLFSSYALVNTGGSLGFLWNDFNANRSRIQLASLDADGNRTVGTLKGLLRDSPDWLPRSGKQVSADEFVIPCLKRNKICFAKVVF